MLSSASGLAASCVPPYISTGTRLGELSLADSKATLAAARRGYLSNVVPKRMCDFGAEKLSFGSTETTLTTQMFESLQPRFVPYRQYDRLELVVVAMNQNIFAWQVPEAWALSDLA